MDRKYHGELPAGHYPTSNDQFGAHLGVKGAREGEIGKSKWIKLWFLVGSGILYIGLSYNMDFQGNSHPIQFQVIRIHLLEIHGFFKDHPFLS